MSKKITRGHATIRSEFSSDKSAAWILLCAMILSMIWWEKMIIDCSQQQQEKYSPKNLCYFIWPGYFTSFYKLVELHFFHLFFIDDLHVNCMWSVCNGLIGTGAIVPININQYIKKLWLSKHKIAVAKKLVFNNLGIRLNFWQESRVCKWIENTPDWLVTGVTVWLTATVMIVNKAFLKKKILKWNLQRHWPGFWAVCLSRINIFIVINAKSKHHLENSVFR